MRGGDGIPLVGLIENQISLWLARRPGRVEWRSHLNPEELRRAAASLREENRENFVLSRGLLREVLAQATGVKGSEIEFGTLTAGKPCLRFPSGTAVEFSLSHSGDFTLIGLSRGIPLGIDLEKIEPSRPWQRLAERFFSDYEQKCLAQDPTVENFFKQWTCKEAYLKLTGLGIAQPLASVTVAKGMAPCQLVEIHAPAGYCASLAIPLNVEVPEIQLTDLS